VILNPAAGRVRRHPAAVRALERLPGAVLRRTSGAGGAIRLARDAVEAGAATVVAAGGDGTVQEVVNGLEEGLDRVRLGVVPLGTGNDLARGLGIPLRPEAAIRVLRAGRERVVDLVRWEGREGAEGRLLVNFAIGGFAGDIADRLDERRKRRWGRVAYLKAAVGGLGQARPFRTSLRVDGDRRGSESLLTIVVANGSRLGHGLPVAPHARVDDGLLDVVTVRWLPSWRVPALLARLVLGRHLDHPAVSWTRARTLSLETRPPMPFNGDGQPLGTGPGTFEVLPRALRTIVPA